ncbi:MAG: epimerase [Bacteroidetes bacterium GWE2_41_25]|nr:MAG: epimerase [Bacteroidetes bacterium GWA2_40_15]OFX95701.1 MAG: epimerase [Bacteroidetes bacterium GWE2_41_25]OFX95829.1 MAG: epimerase [Bacteroidetes bacterium GWC2_40_22]OFY60094.1 MAG: epimerase [Bacteroidetes bacterium GWF2_41_9]HAM09792.1 epimerase [Bacteroidales bacterium]
MKIVIIGGTGHVGTYLVPALAMAGHEVISVSRQKRKPYSDHTAWKEVKQVIIDRVEADKKKTFGKQISKLSPDVVIDMICFTPGSAKMIVEALNGKVQHFLHCGTIWVHGSSVKVPTDETQFRRPFGEYGINKAAIESWLLGFSHITGFPATIIHPGHIVGPGWIPLNPAGNFNPEVYKTLAAGKELALPNLGMETVHHVHAEDVAQAFIKSINNRSTSVGENFHVVSPQALTLKGYATAMSEWFGREAKLRFLPWEKWKKTVSEQDADATWDHIAHSPNCSIEKAKRLISYSPRYTSLQAIQEAVRHIIEKKLL